MLRFIPIILTVCLCLPTVVAGQQADDGTSVEELFHEANESYQDRDYNAAISGYRQILAQGVESAPVYLNLGNAYFKTGDLGRAVLNFLRAQRLDPGDDDVLANLEFARSYTRVQMEGVELNPIRNLLSDIVSPYRLVWLAWISSILFVLFWIIMIIRYGLGMKHLSSLPVLWVVGLLVVGSSFLTTYKYRSEFLTPTAVLICDDCPVYTGPSEELEVELQAAPGLIVEIVDDSGDWYNVLFENKRRGWIRKDLVAEV